MKNYFMLSLYCIFIIILVIDSLFAKHVDITKADKHTIRFQSIQKAQIKDKISFYYNIYGTAINDIYKIGADNVDCFDLKKFTQNIKQGDSLILYTQSLNIFRKPSVIYIETKNSVFIDLSCINERTNKDRWLIPIIGLLTLFGVLLYLFFSKRKT